MFIPFANPIRLRRRFPWKRRGFWRKMLKIGAWMAGAGLIALVIIFAVIAKDLPTPEKIARQVATQESTQLFDRNGKLLYSFAGDKKLIAIPFSDIPETVKQATVAIEDANFYNHSGVSFKGIARAVICRIYPACNRVAGGGSTITQQLVKNTLLTPRQTLSRKMKEVILAVEIEILNPKDKILELYLNSIPYGSNVYGIEAAARTYFAKPAKELTIGEAATLAALPQAPTYYSPYGSHKQELLHRKNYVLDQMVKTGNLTKDQAEEAKKQVVSFVSKRETITAPHFVFYVREQLASRYGEKIVNQGGLKVTTTLDLDVQKMAEQAVEEGSKKLDRYGANNAGLVAIDPTTGEILAMVGSRDYFNGDIDGQVNVTIARRQPGSSFKPIVYVTAFENGWNPGQTLFDLTTDFGGGYTPQNYTGVTYGPVTIRQALANSLNIASVKMLGLVGIKEALETAQKLGITTLNDPNRYGLSLVLGGGEVKLVELTGAFASFANQGQFNPPVAIQKIVGSRGEILEQYNRAPNKQVISKESTYMISDILSDVSARSLVFGATPSLIVPGHRAAVKTGTTSGFHDAWTIGYTANQIAAGVWVGNTDNKAMKKGADGSVIAAPIWNAFMREYLKDKDATDFSRPETVQEITIARLSGKLPTDVTPEVISDLFISSKIPTESDDVYKKVKVNRLNGKLATDRTPKDLIEERVFGYVRSEKPDNPDWEGPVRAWAAEHALNNPPPSEKDDLYDSTGVLPIVTLVRPKNNENISGELTMEAQATAQFGVKHVEFYIDNVQVAQISSIPYTAKYNSALLKDGVHTVTVTVVDQNGASSSSSVTIISTNTVKQQAVPTISPSPTLLPSITPLPSPKIQ